MRNLPDVINWRRLDDRITLSGQPTEEQLTEIRDMGVTHVINLGQHTNKGTLDDEPGTILALGTEYIYILVDFENPTSEKFDKFCGVLESVEGEQVQVHCIYNARVSAFFYRYAKTGPQGSETEVHKLMDGIWRPGGVWAKFIEDKGSLDKPNRFAGDDY